MPRKKLAPPKLHQAIVVPIDSVQADPRNPNVEDVATFNTLVEQIKEQGFMDPLIVVPVPGSPGQYQIVSGEHRWKAAKQVGLLEVTAIVRDDWDADVQIGQNIRENVLRGKLDPKKFAAVWQSLEKKWGYEGTLKLIGMQSKEKEVARLISGVRKAMPEEMRAELDKRADKIRNVEDLAAVVQSLYSKFGSTIEHSFMFLTFGGQSHLLVQLTPATLKLLKETLTAMHTRGQDANELIEAALVLASADGAKGQAA